MPSAQKMKIRKLAGGLSAWLLIAMLLAVGSGTMSYSFNHGIYGSSTTVLAPYNGFHPMTNGFYDPYYGYGCGGCQPDPCNECQPDPCDTCQLDPCSPCGQQMDPWGAYRSWTNPYFYGPVPLYPQASPVWFQSHFKFQGDTYNTQFTLSAPINAVDPYSYAIEVQLLNRHLQDVIMELTIEAPGHLLIFVSGTGSITDVTPTAQGTWIFTLPAVHTINSGLYITVTDPSQMQQYYLLSADISPLRGA